MFCHPYFLQYIAVYGNSFMFAFDFFLYMLALLHFQIMGLLVEDLHKVHLIFKSHRE